MELHEVSQLLDVKLRPLVEDVAEIRKHLFGNGDRGLRERIGLIEQTCETRSKERERGRGGRLAITLALVGWLVTLLVLIIDNWPRG